MSKTLIVGAGISGLGAARLLKSMGRSVLISDIEIKYPGPFAELKSEGFDVRIGAQTEDLLEGVESLVVSPGLSPKIPLLEAARRRHLHIYSEIDLALSQHRGRTAGITGTNGKSTTTTMIAHILKGLGVPAEASGNIGIPPSQLLADRLHPDPLVLELSSYQLDFSQEIRNQAAVFTSFSEDHLERHQSMENYFRAKWKLILATESHGICIMTRPIVEKAREFSCPKPKAPLLEIVLDSEEPLKWTDGPWVRLSSQQGLVTGKAFEGAQRLPQNLSLHNQLNILFSIFAVQSFQKASWESCLKQLEDYPWLAYRFQKIGSYQGHPVYNDSKSTNVESTLMALRSIREPAYLLLGGYPKGKSFRAIASHAPYIRRLIAFGAAGSRIASDLQPLKPLVFATLREALDELPGLLRAEPAPVVFSPACSSFDEFKNFEDRGQYFNQRLQFYLDA